MQKPSVFFDLDGTILHSEMGFSIVQFIFGLPPSWLRLFKILMIPPIAVIATLAR